MTSVSQGRLAEFELKDCLAQRGASQIAIDVWEGLSGPDKSLPSKYFYDAYGSDLFEEICRQPEYYVTRTELDILDRYASEIVKDFNGGDLVELGSGANWKIKKLLDAIEPAHMPAVRYVPVDVSDSALENASHDLLVQYPEISVQGVVADFTRDLHEIPRGTRKLILFLGSTIGNLDHLESHIFLTNLSRIMEAGDRFLLGADMVKPKDVLERAYNDAKGVTREFNRNVLRVVNRELDGNFDPDTFEHVALFNESESRVEMRLRSLEDQEVRINHIDMDVTFERGETILTEICRKFTREGLMDIVHPAGLRVVNFFTDKSNFFCHAEITKA
jgi:L-histidine N-alpha-methyltransferase